MKLTAKTEKEMREAVVPDIDTPEQLMEYIQSCLDAVNPPADLDDQEELGNAYGRCVYAMSLAAVAAFHYVAGVQGVTGFQASCADLDIIKRLRHIKGPFGIYKLEDLLYPQYDLVARLKEFIADESTQKWLKEEATKLLAERQDAAPTVIAHWQAIVDDKVTTFDPADKEMWATIRACLADDEDGQGYLFDHLKQFEKQIHDFVPIKDETEGMFDA